LTLARLRRGIRATLASRSGPWD